MSKSATPKPSALVPDGDGLLKLLLIQTALAPDVVGERHALASTQSATGATVEEIEACHELLGATTAGSLTVMSYHPGLDSCSARLETLSRDRTIVGLAGVKDRQNIALVATAEAVQRSVKISLASEDEELSVERGDELSIFVPEDVKPDAVRWAVLNCHEYTHVDLIREIQKEKIEVLVVVTYNAATRLFWQYAIADVHRLFCYVIIVNVAALGGSGVFAPFRRIGREKTAQIGAAGQIFGASGVGEFRISVDLDIGELRAIREAFKRDGFAAAPGAPSKRDSRYTPMVPSEHFMDTFDRPAGPTAFKDVIDIPNEWNFDHPRVAIAQLDDIGAEKYVETKYRIRNHSSCPAFESLLSVRLAELEKRCLGKEATKPGTFLDLLVLPEVFVPRTFLPALQDFSNRLRCIVIAGVDYPDGAEAENANECAILRPGLEPVWYRKITRSQYDAKADPFEGRMPMQRGTNLVRFVNSAGRGFGALICYDFSHFDLMWELNLCRRERPLDVMVVIAHNPFGELYRSCCIADAHRFYQYVIMCNVARYGGSGVFGPIRTPGARQVLLDAGKGVETIAVTELDLEKLEDSRRSPDEALHEGKFMRRPGVFQTRW